MSPTQESPNSATNGNLEEPVKIAGKKKKKDAASVVGGQTVLMDVSQWPDVAQAAAAETTKSEVKKEEKHGDDQQEESPVTTSEFQISSRTASHGGPCCVDTDDL